MGIARIIAGMMLLMLLTAAAQGRCGDYDLMVKQLRDTYQEIYVWFGVTHLRVSYVTELYVQLYGNSWTILKVYPNGIACVIDTGIGWGLPLPSNQGSPL